VQRCTDRRTTVQQGGKVKKIFAVLLLFCAASAWASVSFVQSTPTAGGAATSVAVTFGSAVTPHNAVCFFLTTGSSLGTDNVTVTDQNGSVYNFAGSVSRVGGFLGAWCTASAQGASGTLTIVTASFATPVIARGIAVEYAGGASTFASLIGNSISLYGGVPCGTPSNWGFVYSPCPTTGTVAMSTGGVTISAGSLAVEFGSGLWGLPTASSPWTSRVSDAVSNITLADQTFSSLTTGVQGAMTNPQPEDRWSLFLLELRQ
jgi:hypothetical protein